jgi:phenylpropionate dioxygenase-like ring-hydroxylating dioxygenase large terminal subunit
MSQFIRNLWYVAAWSHELGPEKPIGRIIIGEPVVLYRKQDGTPVMMEDRCPHRFAPLSLGRIEGDDLRCMYHGLRFSCAGVCQEMPARERPPAITVRTFPVVERWDWLWAWMGDPALADTATIPEAFGINDSRWSMRADVMDYAANWELINDNLCDLSHLDFSHETTLGRASGAQWSTEKPKITALENGLLIDRWFPDTPLSPGHALRVDAKNSYRYLLPGLFLMKTRWFAAGTAARCNFGEPEDEPISTRVEQQAVTPINERSSRYFYATGFAAERATPEMVEGIFAVVNAAFAEDKRILEAQQAIIQLTSPDRRMFSTPHDTAPLAFRRLVEARRMAEAGRGPVG